MSHEFEVVVTDEMWDSILKDNGCVFLQNVFSTPDFQRQLRAWAAEEMRGLVAKSRGNVHACYQSDEEAGHNACRAETLANITAWEKPMKTNDGGPAFPHTRTHESLDHLKPGEIGCPVNVTVSASGMTLRDYFAAKAMEGFCAAADPLQVATLLDDIAVCAYAQADAMLRARGQQP